MTLSAESTHSEVAQADAVAANFETLFQAHWSRVCAVACRIVGDHDEAEDIALEAFWRLYRKMQGVTSASDDRNLPGWLYRVASNLGLNALRARKRRSQYETEAGRRALEPAPTRHPASDMERSEERTHVRRALAQMKPRSAMLLILRHSGLSYAEVAAAVGVAPGSVGTLLARAEREFEVCYRALE
jgi:RNA polymerase sigma-70 factor (ECF subfamily)